MAMIINDKKTGVLSSADINEFAEKLLSLLKSKKIRNNIKNNAKRTSNLKFGKRAIVKKIEKIYEIV